MKKMDNSAHSESIDNEDGMTMSNTSKKSKAMQFTVATGLLFGLLHVGVSSLGSSHVTTSSSPRSLKRRRAQQQQQETEAEEKTKVTAISLIGERHSGTNWITNHLEK